MPGLAAARKLTLISRLGTPTVNTDFATQACAMAESIQPVTMPPCTMPPLGWPSTEWQCRVSAVHCMVTRSSALS